MLNLLNIYCIQQYWTVVKTLNIYQSLFDLWILLNIYILPLEGKRPQKVHTDVKTTPMCPQVVVWSKSYLLLLRHLSSPPLQNVRTRFTAPPPHVLSLIT